MLPGGSRLFRGKESFDEACHFRRLHQNVSAPQKVQHLDEVISNLEKRKSIASPRRRQHASFVGRIPEDLKTGSPKLFQRMF
jgi:hypothetical protein